MVLEAAPQDRFVRWLADSMRAAGWSSRETARRSGLAPSTVAHYASGRNHPSPMGCRALAHAFAVPADQLLLLAGHRGAVEELGARDEFITLLREQPPEVLDEVERWVRPFLRSYWDQRGAERSTPRPGGLSIQLRWDQLVADSGGNVVETP